MQKTYLPKVKDIKRERHEIDAKGKPLGRIATEAAILLRGKHKVDFTSFFDMGDFVTIKNVHHIKFSGKAKLKQKKYYRHSGYLGNLKEISLEELFKKDPEKVIIHAVRGMLPTNKLRAKQLKRLSITLEETKFSNKGK
ncbi:50S ribosomal protein L13 [bacterium (Candidatus Torokbacteria) CG_4_10_14_0_2_um_filter_35_8]|nr:MAG: 50S ribosomal protein L13 [bacterium (Candidatus Torokbacteria) CG_4_10_14_0_2_um_filter_35_8]